MLLSMVVSFILARRFRPNIFVPLITAVIICISYFSVGLPIRALTGRDFPTPSHYPLPLSFPFYSTDETRLIRDVWPYEKYELYFLNLEIRDYTHRYYYDGNNIYHWLFIHYFMLINAVGAILGYGLSKAAQPIRRYFARKKSEMGRVEVTYILLAAITTILLLYVFSHSASWSYFYVKSYYPVSYYLGLSICISSIGFIGLLMGYFSSKNINAIYVAAGLCVYCLHIVRLFFWGLDYVVAVFLVIVVLSVSLSYVGLVAKRPVLKLLPVAFLAGIYLTLLSGLLQKSFLAAPVPSYHFGFPFVWLQAERGLSIRIWRYNFQSGLILDVLLYSAIVYSTLFFLVVIMDRLIVRKN